MINFLKELWGFGLKAYVRSKFCWIWSRFDSRCHFQRRNLDCFKIHEMMYFLWFTTWMLTRRVIINIYRNNCSIKYFYNLVTSIVKVSLQILAEKKFNICFNYWLKMTIVIENSNSNCRFLCKGLYKDMPNI